MVAIAHGVVHLDGERQKALCIPLKCFSHGKYGKKVFPRIIYVKVECREGHPRDHGNIKAVFRLPGFGLKYSSIFILGRIGSVSYTHLLPMSLVAVVSTFVGREMHKRFTRRQEAFSKVADFVQEKLNGVKVIKAFVPVSYTHLFCIACFLRDIAGGIGLHSAEKVQYIRPEIIGLVLGACIMALAKGEFRAKAGSSPATRFVLGAFVMIGALAFLGCPLRMVLRLGGGDLNALIGMLGFALGIFVGCLLYTSRCV